MSDETLDLEAMAREVLAKYGSDLPEGQEEEEDPAIRELGEAMLSPMAGMTGDQVQDAEAETGIWATGAAMMARQLAPGVARSMATCDEEFAWNWISRLVVAIAKVRGWDPGEVAENLNAAMGGHALDGNEGSAMPAEEEGDPAGDFLADNS